MVANTVLAELQTDPKVRESDFVFHGFTYKRFPDNGEACTLAALAFQLNCQPAVVPNRVSVRVIAEDFSANSVPAEPDRPATS
jgi:hypothetical protein